MQSGNRNSFVQLVGGSKKTSGIEIHAYLAGPTVFFPNAVEEGKRMKEHLAKMLPPIIGHFPFDNEIPKEAFSDPKRAARLIADANEKMMDKCCGDGKIGVILVNMKPWRGPEMDSGTAFETGYMSALSRNSNVIIVGYTDDPRKFEDRVIDDHYHGRKNITVGADGFSRGPDGFAVEAFELEENLMITSAIERTGGRVCATFEEAANVALELATKKIVELESSPKRHIGLGGGYGPSAAM
jgi:nucleoside 2-deoxyribosyltransferase